MGMTAKSLGTWWLIVATIYVGSAAVAGPRTGGDSAGAQKLPPVGERKYVIDEQNRAAPVAIQDKGKVVKEIFLKDPVQPGAPLKPAVAKPVAKAEAPKRVVKPAWKPTHLRFGKLAVRGHLARPRVEFNRDILPIGRADEPVRQDFFQRVFEPVRDDNF